MLALVAIQNLGSVRKNFLCRNKSRRKNICSKYIVNLIIKLSGNVEENAGFLWQPFSDQCFH